MKQYVVDSFTEKVFSGNPAAVCVLDRWLPDTMMQSIAFENNLSETAFAVKREDDGDYDLRWFAPDGEIDLCGHATLAAAFVILNYYEEGQETVNFHTQSDEIRVQRMGKVYSMDFPTFKLHQIPVTEEMTKALGAEPKEAFMGRDLICVFENEGALRRLNPDMLLVKELEGLLLHVTAPGDASDCVTRSFGPKLGVQEDPVCGTGHCHVIPYWYGQLRKSTISAVQASKRGGMMFCRFQGERLILSGRAALYSEAEIYPEGLEYL